MKRRFIIINNGMGEVRGHFFETAVSVAEAARDRGFRVALATHVNWADLDTPEWLDHYPIFTVDHWRRSAASTCERSDAGASEDATDRHRKQRTLSRRIKEAVVLSVRELMDRAEWACGLGRGNEHDRRFAAMLSSRNVTEPEIEVFLEGVLRTARRRDELELCAQFGAELEQLLHSLCVGPNDVVFLPTAHSREAFAIRRWAHHNGDDQSPHFHFEFRHAIAPPGDLRAGGRYVLKETQVHKAFLAAFRAYPEVPRMHFYTDTHRLSTDFSQLTGLRFDVLPIPFRARLIPATPPAERQGCCVLYLGEPREEKGFHLLPGLIQTLLPSHIRTGRIRFEIQAGIHSDHRSRKMRNALSQLKALARETAQVRMFGQGECFLAPEEYYQRLAEADIVLLPYDARAYRARSSGVLAEAIAAGKPTVVCFGTWLAEQQVSGETYSDQTSLAHAVVRVCDGYEQYQLRAHRTRPAWVNHHSPENLIGQLRGCGVDAKTASNCSAENLVGHTSHASCANERIPVERRISQSVESR